MKKPYAKMVSSLQRLSFPCAVLASPHEEIYKETTKAQTRRR